MQIWQRATAIVLPKRYNGSRGEFIPLIGSDLLVFPRMFPPLYNHTAICTKPPEGFGRGLNGKR
jgi:hypothetical protein